MPPIADPGCTLDVVESGSFALHSAGRWRARCRCRWRGSWLTSKAAAKREHRLHRNDSEEAEPSTIRAALDALRAEGLIR